MFTGIVEETGTVVALARNPDGARLTIATELVVSDAKLGDSIAVDGCCLTIVEIGAGSLAFDLGPETLAVTTLGAFTAGTRVHLERAVRLQDRLGGHLVQGHVDAVGSIERTEHK